MAGHALVLEHPKSVSSWTHLWVDATVAEFPAMGFADLGLLLHVLDGDTHELHACQETHEAHAEFHSSLRR
eukprot:6858632-Lingulodinium_polyedra.AAC.1